MIVKALLILVFSVQIAQAQGFAGLGTQAEDGFSVPDPTTRFAFPRDHLAHPDFRIEWWYLTANMTDADGNALGLQWTLFRSALAPRQTNGWDSPQIWMGHAAVTTDSAHYLSEKLARDGIGQAGVTGAPFSAWIDDWHMTGVDDTLNRLALSAGGVDWSYDLDLVAQGPLVPQGQAGYSVKSPEGQASYYYSQPFFTLRGTVTLPDGPRQVTGQAWLDREWSSQPLGPDQTGWDWFSLHLDSGDKVMGFRLRSRDGDPFTSGTWIAPDGTPVPMARGAFRADPLATSSVAGREVPTSWRVQVPSQGLDVTVGARNPQAWMDTLFSYWEGPVTVAGTHGGVGYLEMTGYDRQD